MHIENQHFFVSLFEPEGSGVAIFKFKKIKIELNVKHSIYDWKDVPLTLGVLESFKDKKVIFNWLPMPFGCLGWRVNIFLYN